MTSLNSRELGATLRQCALTGQPANVLIDHRIYTVVAQPVDGTAEPPVVMTVEQACKFAAAEYARGLKAGRKEQKHD